MTSLKTSVRDLLQQFAANHQATGEHVAVDIFRVLQEESQLLYETHCIRDLMDQDPFHCYQEHEDWRACIESFKQSIQVVSCHRLERGDDYCFNQAIVQCHAPISGGGTSASSVSTASSPKNKKQKRQRQNITATTNIGNNSILLHFRYERDPATETTATSIWYSIDLSKDFGPKQNILTIRVWADGNKPSQLPAVSVDDQAGMGDDDGDDDDWEDMNSDDDEVKDETDTKKQKSKTDHTGENKSKASKLSSNKRKNSDNDEAEGNAKHANQQEEEEEDEEEPSRDRYACFVDPDVLQSFQQHTGLTALDEATTFFTLMTFPFYQNEFDLVGFVLDSVFGYDEQADDNEDNAGSEDESDK